MKINFAEEIQVMPLLAPIDIVANATATQYVKMSQIGSGQLEIELPFGVVTSTDSTGEVVITVEANDVNDTSSSDDNTNAIAFNYRLSAAVGTGTMGAITAATSAGASLINTNDNKMILIYVDPAVAAQKYVRAVLTPTSESTVDLVAAVARFVPRKAGNTQISST